MHTIVLPKNKALTPPMVVAQWLKQAGESVSESDVIAQIESASAQVELQAGAAGTLRKIMVQAGQIVADGEAVCLIGAPDEDITPVLSQLQQQEPKGDSAPKPAESQPAEAAAKPGQRPEPIKEEKAAPPAPAATGGSADAVTPILMPQAGQSMEEGTILKWKIKVGDVIEVGQPIVEIETDKANMEVEADHAGRVAQILAQEGEIVEIKVPIALLADNDADAAAFMSSDQAPASTETPATPAPAAPSGEVPEGVSPILMPQAGQSMEEGTILGWKVKEGDRIEVGQAIFEIETDKANMEVEAVEAGRIAKIVAHEGDIVEIKVPVAYLAENDSDVEDYIAAQGQAAVAAAPQAPAAPAATQPPKTIPAPSTQTSSGRPKASPAARKLADQRGVDLQKIATGSGPGGRILSTDIGQVVTTATGRIKASPAARKLAFERGIDLAAIGTGSGPGGRILSSDLAGIQATAPAASPEAAALVDYDALAAEAQAAIAAGSQTFALTKMRKAIAKNLLWSKQNVPHFYAKRVVDADKLFATYKQTKQSFKCTVNDFVVRACAIAIREYAPFRSQYQNDAIVEFPNVNIGVAVGTDDGLLVPVVVDADLTSFEGLAEKTRTVVTNARNGKLDGMGQGIFTISNMGMFGTEEFSAIVNPPESAILAVGAIREDIKVVGGAIKPTRLMTMTISVDHRVIDGALAAQFLNRLKELLETPESLL